MKTAVVDVAPLRYFAAFLRWCGVIGLLAAHTSGARFRHSGWPAAFAILEPLGLVVALAALQDWFGRRPDFGNSELLFYGTGFFPYFLFVHIALKTRNLDRQRILPHTNRFDYIIAYMIGDLGVKLVMFFLLISFLLGYYGNEMAIPRNVLGCFPPMFTLCLLGLSVGLVNKVIDSFWSGWFYAYVIVVRLLLFFSAVLFVLDYGQPQIRHYVAYNPIAQAITWFRSEYYANYPVAYMDLTYLFNVTAAMFAVGFLLEASTREWRRNR
jgi:capsular polysaccharide transport system permease protein